VWLDERGVIIDRNPAADALADVVDLVPDFVLETTTRNGTWSGELRALLRDGSIADTSAVVVAEEEGFVAVLRDISPMKRTESALRHMAERDALTGLRNRRVFMRDLEAAVAAASPTRTAAMLYIDLDHLKVVNDTGGHAAGDRYLEQFAAALESAVRGEDAVARVGGDEFGVLMRDLPADRAVAIAESVRGRLSGLAVRASIGVALIDGSTPADEVLAHADTACYTAKASGGDAVYLFPS
jgi:diguanylate cyclase (GGDEF)-like protein